MWTGLYCHASLPISLYFVILFSWGINDDCDDDDDDDDDEKLVKKLDSAVDKYIYKPANATKTKYIDTNAGKHHCPDSR